MISNDLTTKERLIIVLPAIIVILILLLFIKREKHDYSAEIKMKEVKGIVINKYKTRKGAPIIEINDNKNIWSLNGWHWHGDIYDAVMIGDSLIKMKHTSIISYKSANGNNHKDFELKEGLKAISISSRFTDKVSKPDFRL
jgi:hypothetical protein